jgi:DNA-binding FadR family transcriptional regulator
MKAAERIYAASTSDGEHSARQAEELARRVEDDIAGLGLMPGVSLGSLRELAERYRAGRSVVREAVALLERRGLGRLRPGPCGGFILARPQSATIAAALADYFLATGVAQHQIDDAREAARLVEPRPACEPVLRLMVDCLDQIEIGLAARGGIPGLARPPRGPASTGTRAAGIARQLTAEILKSPRAGARLGSEWDLCGRFGVSRLTLRQAIRLLEDDGLVECRRGRGNGLVIRNHRTAGTIRLVLAYLISEQLDPTVVGTILFQLNGCTPALAVSRAAAGQRHQLEELLSRLESCESFDRYELLHLVQSISKLADSPVVDLFSRCLAAYEARFFPSLAERLPLAAHSDYFQLLRRLLHRISPGVTADLAWAKRESSACLLRMSVLRPI